MYDVKDYERDRAETKLLSKLREAEDAVKDGGDWLSLDELKNMELSKNIKIRH